MRRYYDIHVFQCTNQRPDGHARGSCAARGGVRLLNHMKDAAKGMDLGRVRINGSGCLDRCELGPVMVVYPEGTWYRAESISDVDEILTSHVQGGRVVERLMLTPDMGPKPPAES